MNKMPSSPTASASRIAPLTSVRFFAAILVVLYHYWGEFIPTVPTLRLFENGFMGVSFFYVLSGYILAYVYLRGSAIDTMKFWVARFARIYPSYALALALQIPFNIIVVLESVRVFRRVAIASASLLANLLLLQAWAPVANWRWNPPSWSVSAEAFFYLLFPVLAIATLRFKRTVSLFGGLIVCYLLMLLPAALLLLHGVGYLDQPRPASFLFVVFSPLLRIPEFMIGVFLCNLERKIRRDHGEEKLERAVPGIILVSGFVIACVIWYSREIPFVLRYNGISDLAFAGVILALANARGLILRVFSLGPAVLLGEASYSIYILQWPMLHWFKAVASHVGLYAQHEAPIKGGLNFGVYLLLLVILSVLCYKFVESPSRRSITLWFATHRARALRDDAARNTNAGGKGQTLIGTITVCEDPGVSSAASE